MGLLLGLLREEELELLVRRPAWLECRGCRHRTGSLAPTAVWCRWIPLVLGLRGYRCHRRSRMYENLYRVRVLMLTDALGQEILCPLRRARGRAVPLIRLHEANRRAPGQSDCSQIIALPGTC